MGLEIIDKFLDGKKTTFGVIAGAAFWVAQENAWLTLDAGTITAIWGILAAWTGVSFNRGIRKPAVK